MTTAFDAFLHSHESAYQTDDHHGRHSLACLRDAFDAGRTGDEAALRQALRDVASLATRREDHVSAERRLEEIAVYARTLATPARPRERSGL